MKKLISILVLGLLFGGIVSAEIVEEGDNYLIINETRRDFVRPGPGTIDTVNNYCFSKGLKGFYIYAQLADVFPGNQFDGIKINRIKTNIRRYGSYWPDTKLLHNTNLLHNGRYRYFCANNENEAFNLFEADNKNTSIIRIYPGVWNAFNGGLTKREYIQKYFINTTDQSAILAKRQELEKARLQKLLEDKKREEEKLLREKEIKEAKKKQENIKKRTTLINSLKKKYDKNCSSSIFNKGYEKNTLDYENCLLEKNNIAKKQEKDRLAKIAKAQKEAEIKMASMTDEQKRAYNCEVTFGFKKGSADFKDCIFNLYQIEAEISKKELEVRLKKLEMENERQKIAIANQKPTERVVIRESNNNNNAVADAIRESNRIARAKALIQLGERLGRPPATSVMPFPRQQNCKLNPLNNRITCW